MPIYEYVCKKCGHEFEYLVRGDDKPQCPACGKKQLDRQMSAPAGHSSGGKDSACPVRDACPAPHRCGGGCGCGM